MKIPTITQEMIDAAKAAGACKVPYKVGQPLSDLTGAHARWAEDNIQEQVEVLNLPVPLWAIILGGGGYGYGGGGYGDGGFGDGGGGFGDGGYGDGGGGYGDGFGDGDGGGYGDGSYNNLFKETAR